MKKLTFVSDLYPSFKDPTFGVFVKKSKEDLGRYFYIRKLIVIDIRQRGLLKLFQYLKKSLVLFFDIVLNRSDFYYFHYLTHMTFIIIPFVKNRRYVVNVHGHDFMPSTNYQKLVSIFNHILLSNAFCIVCPSNFAKKYILENYHKINENKIVVNYSCGVDVYFNRKVGIKKIYNFIYFGRIDCDKNWRAVLKAVHKLKLMKLEFKLCICGTGSEVDELLAFILNNGLDDCIDYVGPVANDELPQYINQSYFTVFPSMQESLGLGVLESIACGVPVIAYDLPPMNETIVNMKNGLLVTASDLYGFENYLIKAVNYDSDNYLKLVYNARNSCKIYKRDILAAALASDIADRL